MMIFHVVAVEVPTHSRTRSLLKASTVHCQRGVFPTFTVSADLIIRLLLDVFR